MRRAARNPGTIDRPSDLFRLATLTSYRTFPARDSRGGFSRFRGEKAPPPAPNISVEGSSEQSRALRDGSGEPLLPSHTCHEDAASLVLSSTALGSGEVCSEAGLWTWAIWMESGSRARPRGC